MFIDTLDAPFTNKNLLPFWCNAFSNRVVINEPPIRGHKFFMNTKHGLKKTKLYRIYTDIKTRCYNKNSTHYSYYGLREIKMCDEWKNNFLSFYDWAMSNGYEEGLTIDRYPNQDGNYEPINCRWATMQTQSRNRSSNVKITFNGETKIAVEWAEQYGMHQDVFECRRRRGWSIEDALTRPVRKFDDKYRKKKN